MYVSIEVTALHRPLYYYFTSDVVINEIFLFEYIMLFPFSDTPQLVLVSPLVLTFAPNLSLALSYSVEYSFPGAQAVVELWQLTGYNTAQSTPLPLTVNASWSLNSVIFATVMVSPAPETLVWYGV